jgi:hypothetical protein
MTKEQTQTKPLGQPAESAGRDVSAVPGTDTTIIRRRSVSAQHFLPKEAAAETTVVSRNVLRPRETKKRTETSRERKIAGDLPDWEPLPPGELLVARVK